MKNNENPIYNNNLPPLVDGVGDYTFNLARELAKHGHEVHVICRNKEEIRDDYEDIHVSQIHNKVKNAL